MKHEKKDRTGQRDSILSLNITQYDEGVCSLVHEL